MRSASRFAVQAILLVAGAFWLAAPALGYGAKAHQRLTFLAAKELNRCLEAVPLPQLTPLQVRLIANSNVGLADRNAFVRLFRWNYHDELERDGRGFPWFIDTRFHNHFQQLVTGLDEGAGEEEGYSDLGRIISYIQLVSSPSRAVPVYVPRFWRWSMSDRFESYPLREAELEAAVGSDCGHLDEIPESFQAILEDMVADTLAAVRGPLGGLPATWEAFWEPSDKPGSFGSYGPAGNSFGRSTSFQCGADDSQRCVLVTDDPLYAEFAEQRQLAAVRGTARAMLLFQRAHRPGSQISPSPAPISVLSE